MPQDRSGYFQRQNLRNLLKLKKIKIMIKNTFKLILFLVFALSNISIIAQDSPLLMVFLESKMWLQENI